MCPQPTVQLDRLREPHDIASVLRDGRRRAGRLVVLHARTVPGGVTDGNTSSSERPGGGVRFTVVASRKVGSAVARNRAKRLLREAVRQVDWRAGTDLVLVARAACADSGLAPVLGELTSLADALHLTQDAA